MSGRARGDNGDSANVLEHECLPLMRAGSRHEPVVRSLVPVAVPRPGAPLSAGVPSLQIKTVLGGKRLSQMSRDFSELVEAAREPNLGLQDPELLRCTVNYTHRDVHTLSLGEGDWSASPHVGRAAAGVLGLLDQA